MIGLIGVFCSIMGGFFHIKIFLIKLYVYCYLSLFIVFPVLLLKYYETNAKNLFLQKLLSFISDFKILKEREKKLSLAKYIQSLSLFPFFNSHIIDDYFYGTYNGVGVKISDIWLQRKTSSKHGSNSSTVFAGIFLTLKSFKNYKGKTIIGANGSGLFAGKTK